MNLDRCFLLFTVNDKLAAEHAYVLCLFEVWIDLVTSSKTESVRSAVETEESYAFSNRLKEVLHAFGANRILTVAAFLVEVARRVENKRRVLA